MYNFSSSISSKNIFFLSILIFLDDILYSCKISSEFVTNFANHFLIKSLHHSLFNLKKSHGTANKSFHKSRAKFDVIRVHDLFFASTTNTQTDNHATISFLIGKLYAFQTSPTGNIDITHPQLIDISSYNFLFETG
ncbi:MAG: hypothetical protein Q8S84_06835 [bacterium]|nr:hypothetical protein [bacterium]MDP3381174.1 hypothetical protein [bacterium]